MGRCKHCGYAVEEEVGICPNCGNTYRKEKEEPIFKDEEAAKRKSRSDPQSVVGFVMGVMGFGAWVMPLAGLSLAIVGLVLTSRGKKVPNNRQAFFASAGFVLNMVFLIVNIFMFLTLCMGGVEAG